MSTTTNVGYRVAVLPLAIVAALGLSACGDTNVDAPNSSAADQTIKASTSASFAGRVVDVNGDALSGVTVTIRANKAYTTTTDAKGNYLVEVALGDVVAAGGGGAGGTDSTGQDTLTGNTDMISRNFPLEISKSGFTTYRQVVNFSGQIGYTDGSGAVVLLSQVGYALPKTVLVPYVGNFEFTVYAGDAPAAGAVVTLDGSANEYAYNTDNDLLDYAQTGYRTFVADAEGKVTITAADKLPANGWYSAFVAPFDADADGTYEYDATRSDPIFNLSSNRQDVTSLIHDDGTGTLVQTEFEPSINLRDGSNDISVVYLSIANVDSIPVAQADDFSITVMLNRPVLEETLANMQGPLFSLTSNNGNMPVPFSISNTGGYLYTITPDITLDPSRNSYVFRVNDALAYAGGVYIYDTEYAGAYQSFVIYDPNATMNAAIVPGLDIDENNTYKVDYNRFLTGDMSTANPLTADTTQGGFYNDDLKISFMADPAATDYHVWVKDSNSPWVNVDDAGGWVNLTYNDGQAIEATINNVFSQSFAGGEFVDQNATFYFQEALLNGNAMQVVVMPANINGFSTDPNTDSTIAGLTLADNWGPELRSSGQWNFDGTAQTEFGTGTLCDTQGVNIAVGEPLSSSQTLVAEFATGENGAKAVAGSSCFTVAGVRFTDNDLVDPAADSPYPSNFSYIEVDLAPALTDAVTGDTIITVADNAGFADNDSIDIGGEVETVTGFIAAGQLVISSLGGDVASGSDVYWRGPVQNGYSDVQGSLGAASNNLEFVVGLDDNTGLVVNNSAILGARVISAPGTPFLGFSYATTETVTTKPAVAPGGAVGGYHVGVTAGDDGTLDNDAADADSIASVTVPGGIAAGATVTVTVGSTADMSTGELVAVSFLTDNIREVVAVTVTSGTTFTATFSNTHPAGATVQEISSFTLASPAGFPYVQVSSTSNMQPGSSLTVTDAVDPAQTQTVTVLSALGGSYIVPDSLLRTNVPAPFSSGSTYVNDSSRGADALEVQVLDRSGNNSDATDTDGDGNGNFNQIGYEEVGGASWGVF